MVIVIVPAFVLDSLNDYLSWPWPFAIALHLGVAWCWLTAFFLLLIMLYKNKVKDWKSIFLSSVLWNMFNLGLWVFLFVYMIPSPPFESWNLLFWSGSMVLVTLLCAWNGWCSWQIHQHWQTLKRHADLHCVQCGYFLIGTLQANRRACPECGEPITRLQFEAFREASMTSN